MKAPALGTPRQALLFGALALLLLFAVVKWSGREKTPSAPAPVPVPAAVAERRQPPPARAGRSRSRAVAPDEFPLITARDLEPRLRAGEVGPPRDLFDFREPTPTPPPLPTPAPPPPPGPGQPGFVGPLPPPPPPPTPTPPEITFQLIGIFGPTDGPIAVLQHGSELINAREGDVVLRAFRIQKIGYESIDVGFVGFPPTESRRLAITP
jgi:hypothetical protein